MYIVTMCVLYYVRCQDLQEAGGFNFCHSSVFRPVGFYVFLLMVASRTLSGCVFVDQVLTS